MGGAVVPTTATTAGAAPAAVPAAGGAHAATVARDAEDYNRILNTIGKPNYSTIRDLFAKGGAMPSDTVPAIQISFELFETVQNRFAATKQTLERTKAELHTRNQQHAEALVQLRNVKDDFKNMEKRAEEAEESNRELRMHAAKLDGTIEQLRMEAAQMRTEMEAIQEKLLIQEDRLHNAQNRVAEAMVTISQKDAGITALRRELGKFMRYRQNTTETEDSEDVLRNIAADVEGRAREVRNKLGVAQLQEALDKVEQENRYILQQHNKYISHVQSMIAAYEHQAMTLEDGFASHQCVRTPYYLSSEFYNEYLQPEVYGIHTLEEDLLRSLPVPPNEDPGPSVPHKTFRSLTFEFQRGLDRMKKIDIDPGSRMKEELQTCIQAHTQTMFLGAQLTSFLSTWEAELTHQRLSMHELRDEWIKARVPMFVTRSATELAEGISSFSTGLMHLLEKENEISALLQKQEKESKSKGGKGKQKGVNSPDPRSGSASLIAVNAEANAASGDGGDVEAGDEGSGRSAAGSSKRRGTGASGSRTPRSPSLHQQRRSTRSGSRLTSSGPRGSVSSFLNESVSSSTNSEDLKVRALQEGGTQTSNNFFLMDEEGRYNYYNDHDDDGVMINDDVEEGGVGRQIRRRRASSRPPICSVCLKAMRPDSAEIGETDQFQHTLNPEIAEEVRQIVLTDHHEDDDDDSFFHGDPGSDDALMENVQCLPTIDHRDSRVLSLSSKGYNSVPSTGKMSEAMKNSMRSRASTDRGNNKSTTDGDQAEEGSDVLSSLKTPNVKPPPLPSGVGGAAAGEAGDGGGSPPSALLSGAGGGSASSFDSARSSSLAKPEVRSLIDKYESGLRVRDRELHQFRKVTEQIADVVYESQGITASDLAAKIADLLQQLLRRTGGPPTPLLLSGNGPLGGTLPPQREGNEKEEWDGGKHIFRGGLLASAAETGEAAGGHLETSMSMTSQSLSGRKKTKRQVAQETVERLYNNQYPSSTRRRSLQPVAAPAVYLSGEYSLEVSMGIGGMKLNLPPGIKSANDRGLSSSASLSARSGQASGRDRILSDEELQRQHAELIRNARRGYQRGQIYTATSTSARSGAAGGSEQGGSARQTSLERSTSHLLNNSPPHGGGQQARFPSLPGSSAEFTNQHHQVINGEGANGAYRHDRRSADWLPKGGYGGAPLGKQSLESSAALTPGNSEGNLNHRHSQSKINQITFGSPSPDQLNQDWVLVGGQYVRVDRRTSWIQHMMQQQHVRRTSQLQKLHQLQEQHSHDESPGGGATPLNYDLLAPNTYMSGRLMIGGRNPLRSYGQQKQARQMPPPYGSRNRRWSDNAHRLGLLQGTPTGLTSGLRRTSYVSQHKQLLQARRSSLNNATQRPDSGRGALPLTQLHLGAGSGLRFPNSLQELQRLALMKAKRDPYASNIKTSSQVRYMPLRSTVIGGSGVGPTPGAPPSRFPSVHRPFSNPSNATTGGGHSNNNSANGANRVHQIRLGDIPHAPPGANVNVIPRLPVGGPRPPAVAKRAVLGGGLPPLAGRPGGGGGGLVRPTYGNNNNNRNAGQRSGGAKRAGHSAGSPGGGGLLGSGISSKRIH